MTSEERKKKAGTQIVAYIIFAIGVWVCVLAEVYGAAAFLALLSLITLVDYAILAVRE